MKFDDMVNSILEGKMEQPELNLNPVTREGIKDTFKKMNTYKKGGALRALKMLGSVELKGNTLTVGYMGNMGTGMDSVDKMLSQLNLPSVQDLKNNFKVVKEDGSPSYAYQLVLKI